MKKIKTVIIAFGIFLFFVVLMFILLYQNSSRTLKTSLIDSAEKQVIYSGQRLEERLNEVKIAGAEIINNDTVRFFENRITGDMGNYDYVMDLKELRDYVTNKQVGTSGVEEISIYWKKSEMFVSTLLSAYHQEEIDKVKDFNQMGWYTVQNQLYFIIVAPAGLQETEYLVAIRISNKYLDELLASTSNIEGSHSLLVFTDGKTSRGDDGDETRLLDRYTPNRVIPENQEIYLKRTSLKYEHSDQTLLDSYFDDFQLNLIVSFPTDKIMEPTSWITIMTLIVVLSVLSVGLLIMISFYQQIFLQLRTLIDKFGKVEKGDYSTRIDNLPGNEFDYLFTQFNHMIFQTQLLMDSLVKEQSLREVAEMKQLQSQINPHFLYNSLFYIISVADDPNAVREMSRHLAEYYRYRTKSRQKLTIKDELLFAEHYLMIMSLRKKIDFTIEASDMVLDQPVLPLLLQPIIENAIEHGIENREGAGIVMVEVLDGEDDLLLRVSDDGVGMPTDVLNQLLIRVNDQGNAGNDQYVGLWNVNHRLLNHYGPESGLHFENNDWGGLTVYFRIPKQLITE